jgi:hypothetical protein
VSGRRTQEDLHAKISMVEMKAWIENGEFYAALRLPRLPALGAVFAVQILDAAL